MPLRSVPEEAAVAEVLGTLPVLLAVIFTRSSGTPKTVGGGTMSPITPLVMLSQWMITYVVMKCADSVAMARYRPLRRSDGMPKIRPTPEAVRAPSGIAR